VATTPDYAILAAPRISREGFIRVLTDARSPAASIAGEAYDAAVAAGVDPAVLLGVFRKESSYGRAGRAVRNRSWGNIKGQPADSGGFRIYPDWLTGAKDTIRLLGVYARNAIRPGTRTDTVQTMPYVWAPGPGADLYGDQLAQWVTEWARRYPTTAGAQPTTGASAQLAVQPVVRTTTVRFRPILLAFTGAGVTPATALNDYLIEQWAQYVVESAGSGAVGSPLPWAGVPTPEIEAQAKAALVRAAEPYRGQPVGQLPETIQVELPSPPSWVDVAIGQVGDLIRIAVLGLLVVGIILAGLWLVAKS
jgi:hypothetical protein